MNPKSRRDGILVTDLEDEIVLYDERNARAHRLNRTAACVWRRADGETSIAEIATLLANELSSEPNPELVEEGLASLEEAGLLDPGPVVARRKALRRVAVAAALVPLIWSIPAPLAARAGSG